MGSGSDPRRSLHRTRVAEYKIHVQYIYVQKYLYVHGTRTPDFVGTKICGPQGRGGHQAGCVTQPQAGLLQGCRVK